MSLSRSNGRRRQAVALDGRTIRERWGDENLAKGPNSIVGNVLNSMRFSSVIYTFGEHGRTVYAKAA